MSHLSDEQLSMLVDGELSLASREAAGRHLRDCVHCTQRLDELVDVCAELRLTPAVSWSSPATERVLTQLTECETRHWSAPIAATLAIIGAVLLVQELALIRAVAGVLGAILSVLAAFLPSGVGAPAGTAIGVLLVVAVLGPLLAMPLARRR